MKKKFPILLMIFVFGFISCQKEGADVNYKYYENYAVISEHLDLPGAPFSYKVEFPEYYTNARSLNFDPDLATLGRVLFYDTNLSKDATISCASCHKQEIGFSDDVAFSKGTGGLETDRNSLALGAVFNFNEYYGPGRIPFFWDNRVSTVQDQSEQTFANSKEMDMEMHEVVAAVKEQPYYEPLFKAAFGGTNAVAEINDKNILDAIGEFVNSMTNADSKFDDELTKRYKKTGSQYISRSGVNALAGEDFSGFSDQENLGKKLYMINCASCHGETSGAPNELAANNGLDIDYEDKGESNGRFKVPTLRNISLTAPYMHDGRFATLEEVVDHYSNGIKNHPYLDHRLSSGNNARQFNFTQEEKEALLAFFETLTDEKMLTDVRYSDPFKK